MRNLRAYARDVNPIRDTGRSIFTCDTSPTAAKLLNVVCFEPSCLMALNLVKCAAHEARHFDFAQHILAHRLAFAAACATRDCYKS